MSEMAIVVIVLSASCHHLTLADSGWSRISWFSRVTLPWLRGGTSVAPWRHKWSHVPVFPPSVWPSSRSNFDLGPSPSDSAEKNSKLHPDWGPDLCESRRRAHSSIGVLRMSIVNILRGLPCRLESLRLKFTNEPSIFCRWGFGWVDKAQCLRSARRFGAVGSSPDFSGFFTTFGF